MLHSPNGMRLKANVPKRRERRRLLIVGMNGNLIVARISVKEEK